MEMEGKSILHFEVGQPDFPTHDSIKKACKDAIDNNLTGYVPPGGTLELKEAVQNEIEKTRGFRPTIEQIVVVPRGKPRIYFPMMATCSPGDEVIFPDPGFPTYAALCDYAQAKAVPISLKEDSKFRFDPVDIAENITSKTKLIILNSPQNPTGSMMTKKELNDVAKLAEEHECYILSDEIYSKIVYDQEFYSPTTYDAASERSFLLDGFSKSYAMTGWRLGAEEQRSWQKNS
ncbi:MAG: aminotransferase class I/II-fold pyridoxal phosphate-dependent enzyme [Candidatus Thorarchaeota archaeon]